jgi:Cof subfamily protein (haloacid dehalogenase superfamily)
MIPDLRLVAVDMDGTLLDAQGRVPDRLWPLLELMRERGILFVPASGRQYATLRSLFARAAAGMPFIAENGTYVVRDDVEISSAPLDAGIVRAVIAALAQTPADYGVVLAGRDRAWVSRTDAAFLTEVAKYYVEHEVVADLDAVAGDTIKIAVFCFGDAETEILPALAGFRGTHQVVVSGAAWVDVMDARVNKGEALRALQHALGIGPEHCAAFGDYLNDLEMLQAVEWSYAMDNAHPDVKAVARRIAPHHHDEGVIAVLGELLDVEV